MRVRLREFGSLRTRIRYFYHRNVISYCSRPFVKSDGQQDLELMHETLISNWNSRVRNEDTTFLLGDFAFGNVGKVASIRSQLNGKIVLVRGNHDLSIQKMKQAGFDEVYNNLLIEESGLKIWMNHIPVLYNDPTRRPDKKYKPEFLAKPPPYYNLLLCGHVHERWKRLDAKTINVGVDVWDFAPRSLDELMAAEITR